MVFDQPAASPASQDIVCPWCKKYLGKRTKSCAILETLIVRRTATFDCKGCGREVRVGPIKGS